MTDSPDSAEPPEGGRQAGGPASAWTMVSALIENLRPHQWVKNLFVLAPLFFSKSFLDPQRLSQGLAATALFCLAAGSVYLFNDIVDVEEDRRHPVKKHRPIPSGRLPVSVAGWSAGAIAVGVLAGSWVLEPWVAGSIGAYMLLNVGYSTLLQDVPFVDVAIIAAGFVLRVMTGKFAIDVYVSGWLLACTFFLALYLALGKRAHELARTSDGQTRSVLGKYRREHLEFGLLFVGGLTIALYTLYTVTAALPELAATLETQPLRGEPTPFATRYLPGTVLFAIFGIVRFFQLVQSDSMNSPTELLLRDVPFVVNLALWAGVMTTIALT